MGRRTPAEEDALELELDPSQLGALDLEEDMWVPYVDLYDIDFLPSRIKLGNAEYAFNSSVIVKGHGATLPGKIHELRAAGKQPVVVERGDRYYVFATSA
jgi:hypothetical protein